MKFLWQLPHKPPRVLGDGHHYCKKLRPKEPAMWALYGSRAKLKSSKVQCQDSGPYPEVWEVFQLCQPLSVQADGAT